MRRLVIPFLFMAGPVLAQDPPAPVDYLSGHQPVRLSFSLVPSMISVAGNSPFFGSRLDAGLAWGNWSFSSRIFLNQSQSYSVANRSLLITLPDQGTLQNPSSVRNPPNTVTFQFPAQADLTWKNGPFSLSSGLLIRTLTTELQNPDLILAGENLYSITWNPAKKTSASAVLSAVASWKWDWLTVSGGFSGLDARLTPKADSVYTMKPETVPVVRLLAGSSDWTGEVNWFGTGLGFGGKLPLPGAWLPGSRPSLSLSAEHGFRRFSWNRYRAEFSTDLTRMVSLSLAGSWVNNRDGNLTDQNFARFLNLQAADPVPVIRSTGISIGIQFRLDAAERDIPVRMTGSRIYQSSLYTAKRSFYTYNPIGTVDLYNPAEDPAEFDLMVRSDSRLGSYSSGRILLSPGELRSLPVYLYLPDTVLADSPRPDLFEVSAVSGPVKKRLTMFQVNVYDRNAWDGDTWNLRYFLSAQDPDLISRAKSVYLSSLNAAGTDSAAGGKFRILKSFLEQAGSRLSYVPDPTGSFLTDRVQYPIETLRRKSGDCEDLVVYTAAFLMAVGYDCAVVDLRPEMPSNLAAPTAGPGSVGHVFLLADTGIPAEQSGETGLGEFQFISRKNKWGETTMWIPVETTVLGQGFQKAFTEGVRQYYEEVIEKNGVENGTVQIYDF
ncbi:MAG: hypothetical protein L6Q77_11825 [Bacteroidetes bacterium]|nr:hypothetical protein [Bacteroidota bacterium]